jgi:hypothetical protein
MLRYEDKNEIRLGPPSWPDLPPIEILCTVQCTARMSKRVLREFFFTNI